MEEERAPPSNASNSEMDSFLTRIGDVTIERVNSEGNSKSSGDQPSPSAAPLPDNDVAPEESSGDSVGEGSDIESEKQIGSERFANEEIEEIHSVGSGDDMDLDETIDSQIGVRLDLDKQLASAREHAVDSVNILDSLPLEGAPIEGQEVTEADLLGKSVSKDYDGMEGEQSDQEKMDEIADDEDDGESNKRRQDSDSAESSQKKQKTKDGSESSGTECESKVEKKISNMRRNIREVMDENQLDEATLAAQRQEMERLRRVQEQQRIIREVQRQIAINRQNNKTQTRVISLLQGKQNQSGTTISPSPSSPQVRLPNTVLLKLNSGQGQSGSQSGNASNQTGQQQRRAMEAMRWQKGRGNLPGAQTSISRVPSRSGGTNNLLQQRIRMMTPSVSISPVVPKKEPVDRSEYYSDSENSDPEAEEALREKQMHALQRVSGVPRPQKPAKGKDVVTISSSSDSSDDDCIVLSDPSAGEETDNEDDPSNSGMHTNDRYNLPDEHGRVLVNVGHPDSEPDVFLAPQVARIIKPHQIGGIRFLYDNIVESIERYKTSSGFGCILAHSMGLGKTLQVASFCDVFFRCTTAKTVLCIMPINTLQNWLAEFNMWLPYEASGSSDATASQSDIKQEIKDETNSLGEMPRLNCVNPLNTDFGQNQNAPPQQSNPVPENALRQSYDSRVPMSMPSYHQHQQDTLREDPVSDQNLQRYRNDISNNFMYGTTTNHHPQSYEHDPVKSEYDCQNVQKPHPGLHPGSTYPIMRDIKQEFGQSCDPSMKREGDVTTEEGVKKHELDSGSSKMSDKKEIERVETPYSVDAPIGLELRPRHFQLHILNDSHKSMAARARVIQEWQRGGGVLLIGYELYRQLSLKKPNKAKRKRGQQFKDMVDVEEDDKNKGLLDDMHSALVSPGPDLVICDEGHRIKNSHASISLALKQMRTKRRIVLTGYPLQNNLLEYWCMVDFVRPNYLGTKSEFCNMFERPIQNGQCIDSTPQDIRLMRYRAHVLHALLEGFVQRRSHSVLQISLPRKEEYILLVRMTPHQRQLYDTFMTQVVKTRAVPNPLKAFAVCCKIWNHPDVLYHFLKKRQANEEDDLDLEETMGEKPAPGAKRSKARQPKGEPKKGKKAAAAATKNKPAASVQPNSSSSSGNDNLDPENRQQSTNTGGFQNFPISQQTNAYPNNPTRNAYPQSTSYRNAEYDCGQGQNYRQNDPANYYRGNGSQSNEYNEFYNNQGQQRYTNNPSFQQFPQGTVGYNQAYQNQTQNYIAPNDPVPTQSQNYPPSSNYRADQTAANNYTTSGIYQSQCYPYQDQSRNYTPGSNYQQVNANQGYQSQPAAQTTGLTGMQEYSSYSTTGSVQQGYASTPNQSNPMPQNFSLPQSQNQSQSYSGNHLGQNQLNPNQLNPNQLNQNQLNQTQQSQNAPQNQTGQIFPRPENPTQNFSRTQNQTDYSSEQQNRTATNSVAPATSYPPSNHDAAQNQSVGNYPTGQSQTGQFKGPEDPYWQQNNYSQSYRQETNNDSYYTDAAGNRYQNNYYPAQGYQNQRYEYNQTPSLDSGTNDGGKTSSRSVRNEGNNKDAGSIGSQNQNSIRSVTGNMGYPVTDPNQQNLNIAPKPTQVNERSTMLGITATIQPSNQRTDALKEEEREDSVDKEKEDKSDDEILAKDEEKDPKSSPSGKEDPGIPYDWATELMKGYVPGLIDASAKMTIFFCILTEAVRLGDRVLAFSQSLFTLNLVEDFLSRNSLKHPDGRTEDWAKNVNYYRLDGSTSALEREKLINEFNANPKIHLFLVSTRAGSLGINLVGANRAIVFDASWNPCHDTQAVCRVYRYGQQKPCFVYRLVTDNCLERKIYDRQISKQGMADRVVDQCNPDAHLSLKEAATLSWDWEEDSQVQDFSQEKDGYADPVMHSLLERHSSLLTKQPFRHESLLVDRKDKKLSQAEKRLARRGYELEKMAANCSRPSYNYVPGNTANRASGLQIRAVRGGEVGGTPKPVASVRPMQQRGADGLGGTRTVGGSRWIPAEVWQRQGMSAQEMTLPLDVVIPTNSPDKGSIVLKAGQRVMVLKSPKGIYMQLESGKIIAIRTALKLNQQKRDEEPKKGASPAARGKQNPEVGFPLRNNSAISIIPKTSTSPGAGRLLGKSPSGQTGFKPFADKESAKRPRPVATATAKPYSSSQVNLTNQVSLSRVPRVKQEMMDSSSLGDNSNSSDSQLRTDQRVEEVRLEDVVAEVGSNPEYNTRTDSNRSSNTDSEPQQQKSLEEKERSESYASDGINDVQSLPSQPSEIQEVASPAEPHCQTINSDAGKTSLKNYRHAFSSHKPQPEPASSDEIVLEEPTPSAITAPVTVDPSASQNQTAPPNPLTTITQRLEATTPRLPEVTPQVYPYSQYTGYYDYSDSRSRALASSTYSPYLSGVPPQTTTPRPPSEPTKETTVRIEPEKCKDPPQPSSILANPISAYQQQSVVTNAAPKSLTETNKTKAVEAKPREETHTPTAFSHPTNARYPAPYPPVPYDAYAQHYPAAPGSSTAYTTSATPGYPAFGGPTYDPEYARVYSAFHGPPTTADPYIHRAYPPPPTHPPNYYPPFPHPPPPPYPNYSFLPPYPNPNLPSEPQPPTQ